MNRRQFVAGLFASTFAPAILPSKLEALPYVVFEDIPLERLAGRGPVLFATDLLVADFGTINRLWIDRIRVI